MKRRELEKRIMELRIMELDAHLKPTIINSLTIPVHATIPHSSN